MDWSSMTALLQHMRLVVITALGCPVDPDVSRNLTIESTSVAACASVHARRVFLRKRIQCRHRPIGQRRVADDLHVGGDA